MSCTIDTRGFLGAMDAAARYIGTGQATEECLRPEIGKVLERAVEYTKAPGEEEFRQRIEYGLRCKFNTYAAGEVGQAARGELPRISICPKAGNVWWIEKDATGTTRFNKMNGGGTKRGGARYLRYMAEERDRVADLAAELQKYLPKALGSRGLTKQSWVQIADMLEIPIAPAGIGWIRGAMPSNERTYQNGVGVKTAEEGSLLFRLENLMPALIQPRQPGEGLDGGRILQSAFDSREKAIMIALEKGIFDDLEKAIKRFPGLALLR